MSAGIYGFNSALVGIADAVLLPAGRRVVVLLVVGCVAAALVTRLARGYLPFPTYTAPFIVTTWALYFLGLALGLPAGRAGGTAGRGRPRSGPRPTASAR